jgi:hypothetical protein
MFLNCVTPNHEEEREIEREKGGKKVGGEILRHCILTMEGGKHRYLFLWA